MYWIERLSQKWSDYLCTHGGKEQEREEKRKEEEPWQK